jgi:POT family proton-dependent oligopeptide transporter
MTSRENLETKTETVPAETGFFGHPRGLATLFFTEMWERFSYYGMRALLILFMTASVDRGGLGFNVVKAGALYGFYTAMVYLLSLPGGWFADRIIGQRRAVLYGGILIAAGEFCLVAPSLTTFYCGLGLLMFGTGLLKPNVSTIVGQLYKPSDHRRDAGFSIFYMGINIGALLAPLACGWVGERISWRLGFGLAGIGMLAGLIQYVLGAKYLGDAGLRPSKSENPEQDRRQKRHAALAAIVVLALFGVVGGLAASGRIDVTAQLISSALGVVLIAITAAMFSWLIFGPGWSSIERKRFSAILVLFVASVLFWAIYEQAGSSLNLFAERSTNKSVLGFAFPASWFQSVPAIFVVVLAPVFAWFWIVLGRHEPSSPAKFSWGLLFVGLGLMLLVPAAAAASHGVLVSPLWLTTTYLLHTIGEMCLSPVGLSAMTKLAPQRVAGLMMGMWFVSIAIGDYLAGKAASLYETLPLTALFGWVGLFVIGAAAVLALMVRPTVRLMGGVK